MNDYHVVALQEEPEPKNNSKTWQKVLIGTGIAIFLFLLVAVSYYLGTKSNQDENEIPSTPTRSLEPMLTLPPTPASTSSATPTKKPSTTVTSTLSPSPTPRTKSIILNSISSLDGFMSSNGTGKSTAEIRAGRNQNLVTRGFVSFDLSDLPNSANIISATMKLYQAEVKGNPYTNLGALKIDHLTYGESLDKEDYALSSLVSNFTTVSNNSTLEWKEIDVTYFVRNDVSNARSYSQFRIHFTDETKGGNVEGDFSYFDSASSYEESSGHPPQLIVKYN